MSKKFFVRQLLFIFIFFYWQPGSIKHPVQTKAYPKDFFNKCPWHLISHLHNIHILKICRKFEKSGHSLTLPSNKQTKFNTTFWKTEQWSRPSKQMVWLELQLCWTTFLAWDCFSTSDKDGVAFLFAVDLPSLIRESERIILNFLSLSFIASDTSAVHKPELYNSKIKKMEENFMTPIFWSKMDSV